MMAKKKYVADDGFEYDGCTGVPDWYLSCCEDHDRAYRFHHISRREADKRFRECIQSRSRLGRLNPLSWWRWGAVRLFGRKGWRESGGAE